MVSNKVKMLLAPP